MTNVPDRWTSRDAGGPGYRRLAIGGFLLTIQGLGTAGSLILFALQGTRGGLDLFGLSILPIVSTWSCRSQS